MDFEIWITFVVASSALLAIPGPTILLVVSYAMGQGRSSGWATVPGVTLGDFTAMTVSLLGAGAILAASAQLFFILKLLGGIYLVWMGVKLWRADPVLANVHNPARGDSKLEMFFNSYVVTALNPKSIIFFVAFVPQFVDASVPAFHQFIILEATFLVLAAVNVALWAILVGEMRSRLQNPRILKLTNRVGGSFLIGAGFLTAAIGQNK